MRETKLPTRCASRPSARLTGRDLRVVLVVPSMLSGHSPASVPPVFRVATTPWLKCRRCVVVSGAGVTSYDRRWYWCRHAHTSSRHAPAPNLHICLLRRHLVDCRSSLAPCVLTAASEASRQHYWCRRLVEFGDCCCCGLLPRAQMTHVHTSSKQHSLGRVIVPMSTAPVLCRWAVQPRGALAIALSSAQRSMRRRPQSDATKPARA